MEAKAAATLSAGEGGPPLRKVVDFAVVGLFAGAVAPPALVVSVLLVKTAEPATNCSVVIEVDVEGGLSAGILVGI